MYKIDDNILVFTDPPAQQAETGIDKLIWR